MKLKRGDIVWCERYGKGTVVDIAIADPTGETVYLVDFPFHGKKTMGGEDLHVYTGKYWYKYVHEECVLCGYSEDYKYRMYSPKPEHYFDRHDFVQKACSHHFI